MKEFLSHGSYKSNKKSVLPCLKKSVPGSKMEVDDPLSPFDDIHHFPRLPGQELCPPVFYCCDLQYLV